MLGVKEQITAFDIITSGGTPASNTATRKYILRVDLPYRKVFPPRETLVILRFLEGVTQYNLPTGTFMPLSIN